MFQMPVRVGNPITLGGLVEEYRSPLYATAVGLVLLGAESMDPPESKPSRGSDRQAKAKAKPSSEGAFSRLADWIRKGFF
jgi:cell division protein FtsA